MNARACGSCTLCCKVMAVPAIDKPRNAWCPHASNTAPRGCRIYATRPEPCQVFECLWVQQTIIPEELRPDKTHVVLTSTRDGQHVVAHVDTAYPDPWRLLEHGPMGRYIRQLLAAGLVVFGVVGDERRAFTPPGRTLRPPAP
jgi:hypothetical protein